MEGYEESSFFSSVFGENATYLIIGAIVLAIAIGLIYYAVGMRSNTMPNISPFTDMPTAQTAWNKARGIESPKEGFYGGVARGAGIPDCLRDSMEAAEVHAMFFGKVYSVEQGAPDMKELTLLLSQLSCFKKDLMGVAQQVEATRYQPFATQIDLEPIAETTARCFAKTIPQRDLELAFDKWYKRGHFLIVRLCTAANLSEAEFQRAEQLFSKVIADVKDVAMTKCLTGTPTLFDKPLSPRDPLPSPSYDISGREYDGYY